MIKIQIIRIIWINKVSKKDKIIRKPQVYIVIMMINIKGYPDIIIYIIIKIRRKPIKISRHLTQYAMANLCISIVGFIRINMAILSQVIIRLVYQS